MTRPSFDRPPRSALQALLGAVAILAATGACRDAVEPPRATTAEKSAGDLQSAIVGEDVVVAPTVLVKDDRGRPMGGIVVNFAVKRGGGSIAVSIDTTGTDGLASVGRWRLGSIADTNVVLANIPVLPGQGLAFTAVGRPAPLQRIVFATSPAQVVAPGATFGAVVEARDGAGNLATGFTGPVTIALHSPPTGATLTGTTTVNAVAGRATFSGLAVSQEGIAYALVATTSGLAGTLSAGFDYTSQPVSSYSIELRYTTPATLRQQEVFNRAVARWRQAVVGDVADFLVSQRVPAGSCGAGTPAIESGETIDDLVIFVRLAPIDGVGAVLGTAGPCFVRSGSRLTLVGVMTFDSADLDAMDSAGQLDDVILHEMGHVMGIGTLWEDFNLLADTATSNPYYTGANGRAQFQNIGGAAYTSTPVPVENTGGAGTRLGHWREASLGRELMTGWISAPGQSNPLSLLTIGSLADLGYQVTYANADAYVYGAALLAGPVREPKRLVEGDAPVKPMILHRDGTIAPLRR